LQIGGSKTRPQSACTIDAGASFSRFWTKIPDLSLTAARKAIGSKALELLRSISILCKNDIPLVMIEIAINLVRQMSRALPKRPWIGRIFVAAAAVSVTAIANAAGLISEENYNRCRAISDDTARLLCFEKLTSPDAQNTPSPVPVVPHGAEKTPDNPPGSISGSQPGPSSIPVAGKWRLVRTPDPRPGREGKDIVSIMATAELSGSDIDFAGLNLRCTDADFEVLVFLLSPLQPQAQPAIAINGEKFHGNVVSPGTAILLPREASDLAREKWRSFPNLSVEVEDDGTKTHGLISLEGFNTALQALVGNCSTR
jgi:hypothetical protein